MATSIYTHPPEIDHAAHELDQPSSETIKREQTRFVKFWAGDRNAILFDDQKQCKIGDFTQLHRALEKFHRGRIKSLKGLQLAIERFTEFVRSNIQAPDPFDFYRDLLPWIAFYACELKEPFLVDLCSSGREGMVSFTQRQIRYLLANSFLLNVQSVQQTMLKKQGRVFGDLDWTPLYTQTSPIATQRLLCQLAYFHQMACHRRDGGITDQDNESIFFVRSFLRPHDSVPSSTGSNNNNGILEPCWLECNQQLSMDTLHIHSNTMEDISEATGFVDFANEDIHIHRMAPSCTQEEVLFSCCPETLVGLLLVERLKPNEAVLITGCRRFSTYRGYMNTFEWTGFTPSQRWKNEPAQNLVVIDACTEHHFSKSMVLRDLGKCYLGFLMSQENPPEQPTPFPSSSSPDEDVDRFANKKSFQRQQQRTPIISTGNWGCGVFGGNIFLKFCQQWMAATVAAAGGGRGIRLEYSTFGNEKQYQELLALQQMIVTKKRTVRWLFGCLRDFGQQKLGSSHFHSFLTKSLQDTAG